ncbi:YtxH domain-containing protein [Maridesulfovibrio sp.]|uniref:YtxH domain-containing protein n=1 Tax=Maridesulfovibrio sp. TaxID=2795000 RepID=UPI0029C9D96C|nr:YtxH domain-containing protein [Maridesulfovibrio sp.]
MNWFKKLAYILCLVALLGAVSACSEEGPAEKAGKQIDEAMDQAKDQMDQMGDDAKSAFDDLKKKANEAMDN